MMKNGDVDALQDAIERLLKHQQRARRTADQEDRMPILIRIADARIEVRRAIKAVQLAAEAGDRDAADALELLRFLSNPGGVGRHRDRELRAATGARRWYHPQCATPGAGYGAGMDCLPPRPSRVSISGTPAALERR